MAYGRMQYAHNILI